MRSVSRVLTAAVGSTGPAAVRDALVAEARAELQACAGTQFDARVVAAFLEVLDEEDFVAAPAQPLPLALR
jgi:hypothetical protein